ncbi:MAG: hypothetical protein HYX38_00990 [Rhodospirillales bacterium]|nr:hypothetical protein [Rhodospirillales bacterium]
MTVDLRQQVTVLEAACHCLLLRPDDVPVREALARTIAASELSAASDDRAFVRSLVDEAQAHADSLAFRLEGTGYDCLCISAAAAMLCQTLALLKLQLSVVGQVDGAPTRHEFGLRP